MFPCTPLVYSLGALCSFFIYILLFTNQKKKKKKTRAGLFSIFQKLHAEVRTQFNTSIRILRSDNAKEYLSGPFSSFMSSHGILYQSFCAYTSQQIGVVERKNRHLVETTCTFLLH